MELLGNLILTLVKKNGHEYKGLFQTEDGIKGSVEVTVQGVGVVRDEDEFEGCFNDIHFSPVKHGLVACPHLWASEVVDNAYSMVVKNRIQELQSMFGGSQRAVTNGDPN